MPIHKAIGAGKIAPFRYKDQEQRADRPSGSVEEDFRLKESPTIDFEKAQPVQPRDEISHFLMEGWIESPHHRINVFSIKEEEEVQLLRFEVTPRTREAFLDKVLPMVSKNLCRNEIQNRPFTEYILVIMWLGAVEFQGGENGNEDVFLVKGIQHGKTLPGRDRGETRLSQDARFSFLPRPPRRALS